MKMGVGGYRNKNTFRKKTFRNFTKHKQHRIKAGRNLIGRTKYNKFKKKIKIIFSKLSFVLRIRRVVKDVGTRRDENMNYDFDDQQRAWRSKEPGQRRRWWADQDRRHRWRETAPPLLRHWTGNGRGERRAGLGQRRPWRDKKPWGCWRRRGCRKDCRAGNRASLAGGADSALSGRWGPSLGSASSISCVDFETKFSPGKRERRLF